MYTYIHTYIYINICIVLPVYIYTQIYTNTYIYINMYDMLLPGVQTNRYRANPLKATQWKPCSRIMTNFKSLTWNPIEMMPTNLNSTCDLFLNISTVVLYDIIYMYIYVYMCIYICIYIYIYIYVHSHVYLYVYFQTYSVCCDSIWLFRAGQWVFKRREMPDPSLWRHKHLMVSMCVYI